MKFTSVGEYFIKLHNVLYAITLIPLLLFAYLHLEHHAGRLEVQTDAQWLTYVILFLHMIFFTTGIYSAEQKLKAVRRLSTLKEKLQKFFSLTVLRFVTISFGCLALAIGVYLNANQLFSVFYIISLIVISFYWPIPSAVCKALRLGGAERDTVLYKKTLEQ